MPNKQKTASPWESAEVENWQKVGICDSAARKTDVEALVWLAGSTVPQCF